MAKADLGLVLSCVSWWRGEDPAPSGKEPPLCAATLAIIEVSRELPYRSGGLFSNQTVLDQIYSSPCSAGNRPSSTARTEAWVRSETPSLAIMCCT
jgi:hypothetical protein